MKNRTKQDIYTLYLRKRRKGVLRMFTIFKEEKVITAGILVFLCLSVLVRLMLAWMYHTMIRETDNMATTGNRLLKQCKVKFANCYQLNGGVSNIPVFVDKFLNRLSFGHLSFDAWYHLSGQCMLFSVVFAGVGICKGILDGRMLGEILPYYIASFLGLYLYFSLSAMIDIKGKRRVLKTNLIDYLEKSPVRQDPGDGAGLRETVWSTESSRQADCRADADPGQGSAAAGDGPGGRKRGVFRGTCDTRENGRQRHVSAGGIFKRHGGRITGTFAGTAYCVINGNDFDIHLENGM